MQLKPIHKEAIASALEKAVRYRVLNEPLEVESICRDVLEIDRDNQQAIATLLLALTDQFPRGLGPRVASGQRAGGAPFERLRKSRTTRASFGSDRRSVSTTRKRRVGDTRPTRDFAGQWEFYEKAEKVRPPGNDDALLRWNTCVRIIESHTDIVPEPTTSGEHQLE